MRALEASRQTYVIDEFCTGAWSDRDEYSSQDISWNHILEMHQQTPEFKEYGRCGSSDFYYLLHMSGEASFEFYVYSIGAWWDAEGDPAHAQPFMWIYGTTFDGIRECSGGQNFTGDLRKMASCLNWIHAFACDRWPRFAEWYAE